MYKKCNLITILNKCIINISVNDKQFAFFMNYKFFKLKFLLIYKFIFCGKFYDLLNS